MIWAVLLGMAMLMWVGLIGWYLWKLNKEPSL